MNWSNLFATVCLELLPNLPSICESWKEVHLPIISAVHLTSAKGALDLHFWWRLSLLEVYQNGKID